MSNNKLGIKGVGFLSSRAGRKKFYAQIKLPTKAKWLGWFETAEQASAAFEQAAISFHGEFFHQSQQKD